MVANTDGDSVPFFLHDLGEQECASVIRAMADPLLTTGPKVLAFETRFAQILGAEHCVALSSCTAALHLALESLGIGPGDEVIVPGVTFAATALAVLHAGAVPVIVDVADETGLIDLTLIEAAVSQRTRAVIPVHLYGQLVDMSSLRRIADSLGLLVIEDAAHCIEGQHAGVRPGTLSEAACFSFFATKNLTSGEGGALVTQSPTRAQHVRLARNHGMNRTSSDRMRDGYQPWDIATPGWKYNMSDLQASMLLPQLDRLLENSARRQERAREYDALLSAIPGVRIPLRCADVHALHLYTVRVPESRRPSVMRRFRKERIGFTVNYAPLHTITCLSSYRRVPDDLPVSTRIGLQTLSLPFYPSMPFGHIHTVVEILQDELSRGESLGGEEGA